SPGILSRRGLRGFLPHRRRLSDQPLQKPQRGTLAPNSMPEMEQGTCQRRERGGALALACLQLTSFAPSASVSGWNRDPCITTGLARIRSVLRIYSAAAAMGRRKPAKRRLFRQTASIMVVAIPAVIPSIRNRRGVHLPRTRGDDFLHHRDETLLLGATQAFERL